MVGYTVESLQKAKAELRKCKDDRNAWEETLKAWKVRNPDKPVPQYGIFCEFDADYFSFLVDAAFDYQMWVNGFTYDSYP